MARLILASSSPRRKELLERLNIPFEIIVSDTEERIDASLSPEQIVMNLAKQKAEAVAKNYPEHFVIGADTLVVYENQLLGKPKNKVEAKQMLMNLSGKSHYVYTGTAIIHGKIVKKFYEKTEVTFWNLSESEIDRYVATGEPLDKAGSYGIQGYGATLVRSINGDFFTVVGLPIGKLYRALQELGFSFS
ncbi:Maf family protein [Bacillus kwashiorkori]|uniref:Maf family protein n=1 Tax=Bacillus kwashiorkori TaxID=1522318 RepID=UPI0007841431|nr:nucleoside triphosphate pyrophosphatase [Bacillus kwashiorkori]